jgi:hypothetical protein
MKNALLKVVLVLTILNSKIKGQVFPQLGAQRAGISALTFLKIDGSPRSSGMGGSQVAVNGDAFAVTYNVAALADNEQMNFAGSNTFYVAGTNHAFFSAMIPHAKLGNFALHATSFTTGAMERRTEFQPLGTGEYFYAYNVAVGLAYSKKLTEMFSYGISLKYINETLDRFVAHTAAMDLGFLYRTDFKNLKFAISLQNFGPNSKLKGKQPNSPFSKNQKELESNPSPTNFSLGISMIPFKNEKHQILTAIQLNHPNDNAENIRLGAEYGWNDFLFFRAGYKINVKDQTLPTFGFGLKTRFTKHPLIIDYAIDPTLYLGWVHRIGLSLFINKQTREENTSNEEKKSQN